MTDHERIAELAGLAGRFGRGHAAAKLRLLRRIAAADSHALRDLRTLHDVLCLLRAYPDDRRVLAAVEEACRRMRDWVGRAGPDSPALADRGIPGAANRDEYSLPLLLRMRSRLPRCFEIDWERFDEQDPLVNALGLLISSPECQGLDDVSLTLEEWFAACRPARLATDLEFLLALFEGAALDPAVRNQTWESCAVPIRYELAEVGTGRCELVRPVSRIRFQTADFDRRRRSLGAVVRRPLPGGGRVGARAGEELIHLAQRTLCGRNLEIRTLSNANADDVSLVDCGRGLQVALMGVVPDYRDPLESHYCFIVLKNGVPVAYGPSTVSLGCCEIGLNLFPEFRGAEIRVIYPQFMRALYHVLGARYFFMQPYGLGRGNPAAIRTGAFWFYRKLGFRPTNPDVEALARGEEERMAASPGYRSSPAMLRGMSHTSVEFDLSNGACRPLALGVLGVRHSRFIAKAFGGDRRRAERGCVARVARALGASGVARLPAGERRAWAMLAPLLAMVPDLDDWGARDKRAMLRILREKGGPSELNVDRLLRAHGPLRGALRRLA